MYSCLSTPTGRLIKESVELFVYLTIGIWRGPNTNKQYPTLVSYGADTERASKHTEYKR